MYLLSQSRSNSDRNRYVSIRGPVTEKLYFNKNKNGIEYQRHMDDGELKKVENMGGISQNGKEKRISVDIEKSVLDS